VQYLPREAVMNTLRSIVDAGAPGSELMLSYVQPLRLLDPKLRAEADGALRGVARGGRAVCLVFRSAGIPRRGLPARL